VQKKVSGMHKPWFNRTALFEPCNEAISQHEPSRSERGEEPNQPTTAQVHQSLFALLTQIWIKRLGTHLFVRTFIVVLCFQ
jgi:hypothetical protein